MTGEDVQAQAAAQTAMLIRQEDAGPGGVVLVLTLDAPPLNGLSHPMRLQLSEALSGAAAEARPVVICGSERVFSAATLIDQEGQLTGGQPSLAELCARIETHPAPVVAALCGRATGPGAELALAAHARVAGPGARIVFPEAGLGLPPMAGTSQRLPRLAGPDAALEMLLSARSVTAEEAHAIGLADAISAGDPREDAIGMALAMPGPRPVSERREGLAQGRAYVAAIAAARAGQGAGQGAGTATAARRIIDCLEAALLLPAESGYALERAAWEDLYAGAPAQALLAAARSERMASFLPEALLEAEPEPVTTLGLYGSGAQIAALALLALGRGLRVIWSDPDSAALEPSLAWTRDRLAAGHEAEGLDPAARRADLERLVAPAAPERLAAAGIVVHARPGPMTSTLARATPDQLQLVIGGAGGAYPGLLLAPSGRLCEIGPLAAARPGMILTARDLLRGFGLPPVLIRGGVGVGRRVHAAGQDALIALAGLGVAPGAIAAALAAYGGTAPDLPQTKIFGQSPREMEPGEILRRWLGAMANAGYGLISEGAVFNPSDIDAIMLQGYGFPRAEGGPMHQAQRRGALVLRAELSRWQKDGAVWEPHPSLDDLVSAGQSAKAG